MASSKSQLRDALSANTVKEKGPPVVDGILSITPDTPEVVEWRRSALDITETSSTYLEDEDDVGPRPNELFGKFTWKIENFSEISKRELRSNVFDVGGYKWYILVYPQGCDVCNHLSLFLCVADYDKLLPGWSHFAQFTIAVVNKDPKKSKYSDTLHRFCKKEHDWGWKKFMELSKVLDGFTVADTLVIKAQVQVILDKPNKPFRCLDPQYRRELVRVYLTNVEGVCRRFCDDKRARLMWVKDEADKLKGFWLSLSFDQQRKILVDKADAILKALVKQFFNEKEVTSTLVMDALYSGCRQIEEHSRCYLEGKCTEELPLVLIRAERNTFALLGDLLDLADRVSKDFIPMAKDDKMMQPNDGLALRSGQEDDYRRDSIERDEKRLAELGRKTVEMLVISHIITESMEASYRDAEALKRQDMLIAEEVEMQKLEEVRIKAQAERDKEKKAKKKEKTKAKKEAERIKKEAEDAERKKQDEIKRLEQERKAQDVAAADRKKQEEDQRKARQQQQARQAQRATAATKQQQQQNQKQQQGQVSASQQGQAAVERQANVGQQQASSATKAHSDAPQQPMPSQQPTMKVSPSASALPAAVHAPTEPAANGMSRSSSSSFVSTGHGDLESSDSASSKQTGTVDQATGAVEDSDDTASNRSERRAELEQEVLALRYRVRALEEQLAERDADLAAYRAQLSELQSTAQNKARAKQLSPPQQLQAASEAAFTTATVKLVSSQLSAVSGPYVPAQAGSRASSDKDAPHMLQQQGMAEAKPNQAGTGPTANGPAARDGGYAGAPPPPPPPSHPHTAGLGPANRRPAGAGAPDMAQMRPQANGGQVPNPPRMAPQQQQQQRGAAGIAAANALQQRPNEHVPQQAGVAAPAAAASPATQRLSRAPSGGPPANPAAVATPGQGHTGMQARPNAAVDTAMKPGNTAGTRPVATGHSGAAAGGGAVHSGAAGILHSSSIAVPADGAPSYKNAAAGVMPAANVPATAAPGAPMASGAAAAAATTPLKQKAQQQDEPSTPVAAPTSTGSVTPHVPRHLNHAAEYAGGPHLMMHQQAAVASQPPGAQGGPFGHVPAKRPQQHVASLIDSPGLDDFAHMGLIDDLLTE